MMKKRFLSALIAVGTVFTLATTAAAQTVAESSSVQILDAGQSVTTEDGAVTISKTVTGTQTENVFDVTLDVTTTEDLSMVPSSADAAVVLVMDCSASMIGERIAQAQAAAKAFVTGFADVGNSDARRMVCVVCYGTDSIRTQAWVDVSQPGYAEALNSKINCIGASVTEGTNMEAGLQLAWNQINESSANSAIAGIENVNVVLLSDGDPTYHLEIDDEEHPGMRTDVEAIHRGPRLDELQFEYARGGVRETLQQDLDNARAVADTIKANGVTLYAVGCGEANKTFLDELDSSGSSFRATNPGELTAKFTAVLQRILAFAQAWEVTDPMGDSITVDAANSDHSGKNEYTVDETGKNLSWNLRNSQPDVQGEENARTFKYSLTYRIVLDTTASPADSYASVATNGQTTLKYCLMSEIDGRTTDEVIKTADFVVPTVRGLFGSLSFTKVDEKGNALSGAAFTLTGMATGSGKEMTITTEATDSTGAVNFGAIPAGEYTLTETTVPEGFVAMEPVSVKVSYGKTTVNGEAPANTIVNNPIATATPVPTPTETPEVTPAPAPTATVTPAPAKEDSASPAPSPAIESTPAPQTKVAQTGDESHPLIWGMLLVFSAVGFATVVVLKKRKMNDK